MTIKKKLIIGFSSLVLIIAALGIYVFNGINTFDEISDKKAASFEQLVDLEIIKNVNVSMTLEAMDLIVDKDSGIVSSEYTNNINELFRTMYSMENELLEDAKGRKDKVDLINDFMGDYKSFEKVLKTDLPQLIINIETTTSIDLDKMDDYIDEFGDEVANDIQMLKEMIEKDLEIASINESEFAKQLKLVIAIAIFLSILLSILIATFIIKGITKSINEFQEGLIGFFKYLNREVSSSELLNDSSDDELGQMAKVVNKNILITKAGVEEDRKFIDETITILSEFEQGDLCQRISSTVDNPALMELKKVLDSMASNLEHNIDGVLNILEQYSSYNYLNKVDNTSVKNHLLSLANGVNSLGDSITQMLVENKQIGLTLNSSSENLLSNVTILNDTSTEAAASLEETAAALEEITSTIVSNTDAVLEMSQFANKVIVSVEEGNTLAAKTTESMDEINEQVTAINDAISVIDQIAFQTNILSLNAAVEAATAGEAGKGFAVVAQEVRNLASRSAEAAKEIKDLVENANSKTTNGKKISDEMIEGYKSLTENMNKTIELIKHVEEASKEQKSGIEQINDAVTAQDQQTQRIAQAANETKEIAIHSSHISKEIVQSVDKKEFKGKNEIQEQRETPLNISYDKSSEKRSAEKSGRAYSQKSSNVIKKPSNINSKSNINKTSVINKSFEDNTNEQWESF